MAVDVLLGQLYEGMGGPAHQVWDWRADRMIIAYLFLNIRGMQAD